MSKPASKKDNLAKAWAIASGVVTVVVLGVFLWPRSRVEFDDRGYDLATALYRVCNQQSVEGLARVEVLLAEADAESHLSGVSRETLRSIIAQAKRGRWKEASTQCRRSLEDQVIRGREAPS